MPDRTGWWGMACWNGLSTEQQRRLIEVGNLPFGYRPEGTCEGPPVTAIETLADMAPGPRFYCAPCAVEYLTAKFVVLPAKQPTAEGRR